MDDKHAHVEAQGDYNKTEEAREEVLEPYALSTKLVDSQGESKVLHVLE
jgi:hypothetical protein